MCSRPLLGERIHFCGNSDAFLWKTRYITIGPTENTLMLNIKQIRLLYQFSIFVEVSSYMYVQMHITQDKVLRSNMCVCVRHRPFGVYCSVTFGNMSILITTHYYVSHKELDISDNKQLLFSDLNALKICHSWNYYSVRLQRGHWRGGQFLKHKRLYSGERHTPGCR